VAIGAAAPLAGGGAPGARVGSLIVGADVGLGGRLMRTVSFFGWTLAASAGLGGMEPPPGDVGIFSAISFIFCDQRKVAFRRCQTRNFKFRLTRTMHYEFNAKTLRRKDAKDKTEE
jgi:hypothetical protein